MTKKILIKDILNYLKDNEIEHSFYGDESEVIEGFSTLFNYKNGTMTFISTLYDFRDYKEKFKNKKIKLMITDPSEKIYKCFNNTIQIKRPTNVFFSILDRFFDNEMNDDNPITCNQNEYSKQSFISDKAIIGENVKIGVGCVIEPNVQIGDNTEIHHNVVLRNGTKIGEGCIIESGTVIGEEGFNPSTQNDGTKYLLKHFGRAIIEDYVHIGTNCNIHKGSIDDTIIKKGTKINTMVHIAHNCIIGENTVITMPTHICGSVKVGKNCHVAATTIRNQCSIGDNAVLGLGAVVVKDVEEGMTVVGNPARPLEK